MNTRIVSDMSTSAPLPPVKLLQSPLTEREQRFAHWPVVSITLSSN